MMELERIIRKRLDAALSALDSAYVALNGIPSNLDPDAACGAKRRSSLSCLYRNNWAHRAKSLENAKV